MREFCKSNNLSEFQLWLSLYSLLFYIISGNSDICIGGIFANRYRYSDNNKINKYFYKYI